MLEINKIHQGDSLELLKEIPDNSIDSIVTDPPYELGFMNKNWDKSGIANNVELWKECLRVLKPGGHLLSFGGARTYHRMASAVEDAGFEIRDQIQWIYGSGMPKSVDISRRIDGRLGSKRGKYDEPITSEAIKYKDYGSALKPASEPITMARKPLSEKTIADNVLEWGTGGLNIGESRIPYGDEGNLATNPSLRTHINGGNGGNIISHESDRRVVTPNDKGRFPTNVILDEVNSKKIKTQANKTIENKTSGIDVSKYFYCPKASKKERGEGNKHPTVKPIKLMEYLVNLITPENGIVLDPFAGSGSTLLACINMKKQYIGLELEQDHVDIANRRINEHAYDHT